MDSDRLYRASGALPEEAGREIPDRIPLEWTEPVSPEVALQDALRSTQECAAMCLAIVPTLARSVRGPVSTVFGVASLAAELLEEQHPDRAPSLALCVRIIDSNLRALDQVRCSAGGFSLGVVGGRCADRCRRALAALYLSREELD